MSGRYWEGPTRLPFPNPDEAVTWGDLREVLERFIELQNIATRVEAADKLTQAIAEMRKIDPFGKSA